MSAEKTLRWLHLFDLLSAHPGGPSVRQLHGCLNHDDAVKQRDLEFQAPIKPSVETS